MKSLVDSRAHEELQDAHAAAWRVFPQVLFRLTACVVWATRINLNQFRGRSFVHPVRVCGQPVRRRSYLLSRLCSAISRPLSVPFHSW